jgi:hypothetical protein
MKKLLLMPLKYLAVFIPMTAILLLPIFYFADVLGEQLIAMFGETGGLFMRPLVISGIYIGLLTLLLSPSLTKVNSYLWFKCLSDIQIRTLYKTYIYGLGSFAVLITLLILMTLFFYSKESINWFNTRDYMFFYLLIVLAISPIILLTKKSN